MTSQLPNADCDQIVERSEIDDVTKNDSHQNWLKARVNQWRVSGLISDEQSEAILNFESVPEAPFRLGIRFSRLIVILSTLGAVLVGAGIISFVAANWQDIPAIAKLAMLTGGQTVTYWGAYQLQFVRGYPRVGGAIMFAGAAWFGANVFLVAQSYHLAVDNPDLLIWWFVGVLPLAYVARSKPITVMSVAIFTVGISWKTIVWGNDSSNAYIVLAILLLGAAAIYALGMLHLKREQLRFHAGPYLVGGALLAIGATYVLTFEELFSDFRYRGTDEFRMASGSLFVLASLVSVIAISAFVVADRLSEKTGESLVSRFTEPGVVALVITFGWFVATLPFGSPTPYVIASNLILIVLIFGTITLGIVRKREALVNVGIIFFVIDLSTRYIELTIDMLETSLAFIVGGVLLLVLGYGMERARRRLLHQFGMTEISHDS